MPTNNAGEVLADPAEAKREQGRAEDALRSALDTIANQLGPVSQAIAAAKGHIETIKRTSERIGLDRTKVTESAEAAIQRAQEAFDGAFGAKASRPTAKVPASVKKADAEAEKLVDANFPGAHDNDGDSAKSAAKTIAPAALTEKAERNRDIVSGDIPGGKARG